MHGEIVKPNDYFCVCVWLIFMLSDATLGSVNSFYFACDEVQRWHCSEGKKSEEECSWVLSC